MTRSHLNTLELHLSNERGRLQSAKTDAERAMRSVWVSQLEKEIAGELAFLAKEPEEKIELTDDELLAELMS